MSLAYLKLELKEVKRMRKRNDDRSNSMNPNPQILGMNPETIQNNSNYLINLGISSQRIKSRINLLGRNSRTIQNNYNYLRSLGITSKRIDTYNHLLTGTHEGFDFDRELKHHPEYKDNQDEE